MFLASSLEGDAWRPEYYTDLVACSARHAESDALSRFLTERAIPWVGRLLCTASSKTEKSDLIVYSNKKMEYLVNICSSVVSAMLPAASIIALYFVQSLIVRLGVLMAFTTIFAVVLVVVVQARRVEIFAATTA